MSEQSEREYACMNPVFMELNVTDRATVSNIIDALYERSRTELRRKQEDEINNKVRDFEDAMRQEDED